MYNNLLKNHNFQIYLKKSFIINFFRINKSNYFFSFLDSHLIHYPTPTNLTYAWSFGSLAGICLIIQIITGIFLATHYTPNSIHYARCS